MKAQLSFLKIYLPIVACLAAWGCIPQVQDRADAVKVKGILSGSGSVAPGSPLAAFRSTVYPLATARCVSCHIATVQPFFASADISAAYDSLISGGKVNLQDPASSRLVVRLSVDHHNCWSDCAANASEMQAAIAKWRDILTPPPADNGPGTPPPPTTPVPTPVPTVARYNTVNMLIPAGLSIGGDAAANFVKMTWPLDSPNDTINPEIAGATFSLEIQAFDNFSYRIRNPRITTPRTAVYVYDIRLAINGLVRANDATYSLLDQSVPINTTGTILAPAPMIMLTDKGKGLDQLAISFAKIQASNPACKNLAGFTSMVKSVMTTSCVRCHSTGNVFDMTSGTDASICLRTLGRVDLSIPMNSSLIVKSYTGTNHPGGGNLISQTTMNSWITWITSER